MCIRDRYQRRVHGEEEKELEIKAKAYEEARQRIFQEQSEKKQIVVQNTQAPFERKVLKSESDKHDPDFNRQIYAPVPIWGGDMGYGYYSPPENYDADGFYQAGGLEDPNIISLVSQETPNVSTNPNEQPIHVQPLVQPTGPKEIPKKKFKAKKSD
eukprot:TRINITY_DN6674_c0_g3_i1.p1 TRINITY_DN6674_c0_g3~~TRINITY_DN6674_c0_g3_i1.p1  ORF type:complete len:165 (+),score=27.22 TRINITY_DN6674_c0_g3_i1:30-497(+)